MYDVSFDSREPGSARRTRWLWAVRIAAIAALAAAASTSAQMPGTPVLQNAWASPGMVGAIDFAGGPDGSVYAAALSWAPGTARFQLSGGFGARNRSGGGGTGTVYGVRLALPFTGSGSSFGFAGFAGIGGASKKSGDTSSTAQVPVGVAIGWRRAIGGAHGVSLYATPNFVFSSGGSNNSGLFRTGVGADIGLTNSLGVTAGAELGATRSKALGGPSGVLYGVGVSYAFGRR